MILVENEEKNIQSFESKDKSRLGNNLSKA